MDKTELMSCVEQAIEEDSGDINYESVNLYLDIPGEDIASEDGNGEEDSYFTTPASQYIELVEKYIAGELGDEELVAKASYVVDEELSNIEPIEDEDGETYYPFIMQTTLPTEIRDIIIEATRRTPQVQRPEVVSEWHRTFPEVAEGDDGLVVKTKYYGERPSVNAELADEVVETVAQEFQVIKSPDKITGVQISGPMVGETDEMGISPDYTVWFETETPHEFWADCETLEEYAEMRTERTGESVEEFLEREYYESHTHGIQTLVDESYEWAMTILSEWDIEDIPGLEVSVSSLDFSFRANEGRGQTTANLVSLTPFEEVNSQ